MDTIITVGKRKASIARLYLRKGDGSININGKDYKTYFPQPHIQYNITDPFNVLSIENEYDIKVNVNGGGYKGQAEAVRLAISKALVKLNEDFRKPLKEKKYLMRDARVVERKKYGKPKARKSFQFSKR
jgi:small subunit ribosomal protein S9